jgi:hypothetical protein
VGGEPLGGVAGAVFAPQLLGVAASDDLEEVTLVPGDLSVGPVKGSFQLVVAKAVRGSHWLSSFGPGFAALTTLVYPNMCSIVKRRWKNLTLHSRSRAPVQYLQKRLGLEAAVRESASSP